MNDLETAARPTLEQMIDRVETTFTVEQVGHVARWMALKTIVAEYVTPPTGTITQRDHITFYDTRKVPRSFKIWMALHDAEDWPGAGFQRHPATLSLRLSEKAPLDTLIFTMYFQGVVLHVRHTYCEFLELDIPDAVKGHCLQITPSSRTSYDWPPPRSLDSTTIRMLADEFSFVRTPGDRMQLMGAYRPDAFDGLFTPDGQPNKA